MKDRIDTSGRETAKKIGEFSSGLPKSDFGYYKEALYKKETGEYFLVGEGGPESKYVAITQNGLAPESNARMKALTFEQAKEWYEDFIFNSDGDEATKKENERIYKHYFGNRN